MDPFYRALIARARKHGGNCDFVLSAKARKPYPRQTPTARAQQQQQQHKQVRGAAPPELDSSASPVSTDLSKRTTPQVPPRVVRAMKHEPCCASDEA
jgi:hypothetical protein